MAEDELIQTILDMPNLTINILKRVIYRLRKRMGRCIIASCPNPAIPDQVRCLHHQQKNSEYAKTYQKSLKND